MTLEPIQYLLGALSGSLVSFTLGLVGGGGSILAVPLMVYLVRVPNAHLAIGTSAFAVAVNAATGLASHAARGTVRWRFKADAPILAAVTPTAGGLVFTADMDANAYALDAATGRQLWRARLPGVAGGGVITYVVDGRQYVAFAAANNSPIWPHDRQTAKVVVFAR